MDKLENNVERLTSNLQVGADAAKQAAYTHIADIEDAGWRHMIEDMVKEMDDEEFLDLFVASVFCDLQREGFLDEDGDPTDKLVEHGLSVKMDEWIESGELVRREDGTLVPGASSDENPF